MKKMEFIRPLEMKWQSILGFQFVDSLYSCMLDEKFFSGAVEIFFGLRYR